jgi:UDP-N-acetyl-D-glucosamine dehydrogenase
MLTSAPSFAEKITSRTARIGIVGLGYAGLPLALGFAEAGFQVTGIDLDCERVDAVRSGTSYLVDVPSHRYSAVDGRMWATDDYTTVRDLDAITICVPTPLSKTRTPDVSYVLAATRSIAEHLRPGQLIVLQSTTYPGTTQDVVRPLLEQTGLVVGEDFFLGYAPERVDPGNVKWGLRNTPRVVSGVTGACLENTMAAYASIVDRIIPVSSTTVAELIKLHENTFRAVNIALANELALMCDRLRVSAWEVIEGAASKPFAFLPHYPGPGLGGDCIPVVPHFLSWRMREYGYSNHLIEAAHQVNAQMPQHVAQKVGDALNHHGLPVNGARVLVLGVAYKADVSDTRESPSLEIMRQLAQRGADVRYCDPCVPALDLDGREVTSSVWCAEEVEAADCVVLITAHHEFLDEALWEHARVIVDTRNVVPYAQPNVWRI